MGDLVDYGADPIHCARTCLSQAARCIAGNHDLYGVGRALPPHAKPWVRAAAEWTADALPVGLRQELGELEPSDTDHPVPMFHGSPRNPVREYVADAEVARACLEMLDAPVSLVGHTHVPAAWHLGPDGSLAGGPISGEEIVALTPGRWLINPGSVGQPRDGDARAAWAILDLDAGEVRFRRTPYDVAAAQNTILTAGLPAMLADRLSHGR